MYLFYNWHEAWSWCNKHATDTVVVLVADWRPTNQVTRLKWDAAVKCFFVHP